MYPVQLPVQPESSAAWKTVKGLMPLAMDFEAFAVSMAVKTAVWPADSEAESCCRRKAVWIEGSSMLSTRFVALASKGL